MRVVDLFESRRPHYAEHSANEAVLKSTGQRFYSGAFDPLDGHILEIHSWEEAFDADHHHSHYFTPRMIEKMREEEASFSGSPGFSFTQCGAKAKPLLRYVGLSSHR